MKKTISSLLYDYILLNSFILMAVFYCLCPFLFDYIKPGLVIVVICLFIWKANLNYFKYIWLKSKLYIFFLISILLSGFNYMIFDLEDGLILFIEGIYFLFIPMIFFVVGQRLKSESLFYIFIRNIIFANLLICIIGLFLYFASPYFYIDYLGKTQLYFNSSIYTEKMRMASVIGSTGVGNISAYSIPLIFLLYEKKKIKNYYFFLMLIVFILSVILSFQRGAWAGSIFALGIAFLYYLSGVKYDLNRLLYIPLVVFILYIIVVIYIPTIVSPDWLSQRLNTFNYIAITERSYQWLFAIEKFYEQPTGYGIGSHCHRAIAHGHIAIPDGNYFRMLIEYGFVGFTLFVCLLSRAIFVLYRKNIYMLASLMVFVVQALGSNVIDFPYLGCFFWFILGCSYNELRLSRFESPKSIKKL